MKETAAHKAGTFVLLLPWVVVFGLFWLYPLCYSFFLSLTEYKTLSNEAAFIGLDNYRALFSDELFWKSLKNTAVFTLGTVPVTIAFATFLAVLINNKALKLKGFFRASFFIPSVTSLVVIALIFKLLYSRQGYISFLMGLAGMEAPADGFLLDPGSALYSVMAMDVWVATGYYVVLILAGLQSIPDDLYESAMLSGANAFQRFRLITLPLLRPTLVFVLIINTIKSFQVFIEIYVMTRGGPLDSTSTLVYQVYRNAFEEADKMGYASALAYILFAILLILSLLQLRLSKTT